VEVEEDSPEHNTLDMLSDIRVVVVDLVLWLSVISRLKQQHQKQLVVQLQHLIVKLFIFSKTLEHSPQQVEISQIVR